MARPKRPDPISEGSIGEIYRHFFGPLTHYKPAGYLLKDWLESLFDIKQRDITRFVANKKFKLPGLFCAAPLVHIQGIGYRDVKKGDELWVRRDARAADRIEVEYFGGQGSADQVFILNESEWGAVRLNLKEADRKRRQ